MNITRILTLVVCVLLAGCSSPTIYRLVMSAEGEGVHRALTVENGDGFEDRLRTIYAQVDQVEGDDALRFSGVFDELPGDVGGSGTWLKLNSPVGSVYSYAERFRGNDDLVGQVETRLLATDRVADVLIAWFESELSSEPTWATLHGFMDTQMRRDMKNLSLYVLEMERRGEQAEDWGMAYVARVGQYLMDREYLTEDDLVLLMHVFTPEGNEEQAGEMLRRKVAARMGLDAGDSIPGSLDFLSMSDGVIRESWERFLASEAGAAMVAGWGLDPEDQAEPMEEGDVEQAVMLTFLAAAGIEFELFSSPDEVHVELVCNSEPLATNGEWDGGAGRLTWSGEVRERFGLPLFYYARWAEADEAFQAAHFGSVVIQGEELAEMVAWYTGLSEALQAQWDGFVSSLDPAAAPSLRSQAEAAHAAAAVADEDDPLGWGFTRVIEALGAPPE